MTEAELIAERDALREQLESHRQRELADLREQVATLIVERDHYRAEALRNAEIGKQIVEESKAERDVLLSQINAFRSAGLTPGVPSERATNGLGRAAIAESRT